MTVRAAVALTKRVPAGVGVSYGHTYFPDARDHAGARAGRATPTACRARPGTGPRCWPAASSGTIAGRVCMDQFVLDVGDAAVGARRRGRPLGHRASGGEPTAQQWADAVDTIHYELVTRVGGRFARRYVGSAGAV